MLGIVRDLVTICTWFVLAGSVGKYTLVEAHDWIKEQAIRKIQQGLTPMSKMNEQLTCIHYDQKYNPHRIMKGACGKYWRKTDQKRASHGS